MEWPGLVGNSLRVESLHWSKAVTSPLALHEPPTLIFFGPKELAMLCWMQVELCEKREVIWTSSSSSYCSYHLSMIYASIGIHASFFLALPRVSFLLFLAATSALFISVRNCGCLIFILWGKDTILFLIGFTIGHSKTYGKTTFMGCLGIHL